jgi:Transposase DDE domain group 1
MTQCKTPALLFQDLGSREVSACFDGGQVTSDAGGLLLREVEQRFGFIADFARCFTDHRDPELIEHTLEQLLKQRIFGLCLGYEDLNDHDQLRHDPLLAVAVGKLDPQGQDRVSPRDRGKALAGKSTLNRLELTPVRANADSRYKKIVAHLDAMQAFLVDAFLQQHAVAPERIVLDVDSTDNPLHGHQLGRFFHGYYDSYCYLPLYIFCGDHPLLALLRPSNIDTPTGLRKHLIRIVTQIRQRWPHVQIVLRGDSGFCREYLMHWCETNGVDYLFGLPKNARLLRILGKELQEAKDLFAQTKLASRVFKDFDYRTHKTWSRPRRVVGKAEHLAKGANPRFVVTSLTATAYPAQTLYEKEYCGRGDMENRIKEQQLFLFACRVSCATMRANQVRVLLSTVAYMVMRALRQFGLQQTELAHAQCDTIRLKLLKIGAIIRISVRRVYVSLSESYPFRTVFMQVHENLCQAVLPVPAVVPSG